MIEQLKTIREAFEATQLKRECRRLPNGDYENSFVNSAWRYFQAGVGAANDMTKGQKPVAWLCIVNTADAGPTKFFTAPSDPRGFPVYAAPVAQQPQAEPDDEILKERDDAEDFIDMLLDEVLGTDRPEWTSAYGRDDALRDVQERMTALHKPTVDKAWDRFEKAQQPQADSIPVAAFDRLMALCESQAQRIIELEDKQSQPRAAPGYVLVPAKPTPEMWHAWDKSPFNEDGDIERNAAWSAMLKAAPQQAEAVPPGYVLVPVEPNDEMIDAACEAVKDLYRVDFVRAYEAAISQQKGGA